MPDTSSPRIGIIGLGTMGAALALNIADHGVGVAVHNRSAQGLHDFLDASGALREAFTPADSIEDLVRSLAPPRTVLVMVTAGPAVDAVIEALLPHVGQGDLIVDGGNADFHDTRRREAELSDKGLNFLGMGVSGGEEGARHGPSMMVGGSPEGYARIQPIVEAIAARYQGEPCVAHLGPDGAGHFVKTVHNGIEYADMQIIAEVYGLLRHGQDRPLDEIAELFASWNDGPLQSFLVGITADILGATDPEGGGPMIDAIRDTAGQKGTGRWTLIEALRLGQSASAIEAAVAARSWSSMAEARQTGAGLFPAAGLHCPPILDVDLEAALLAARIIAHGQGFQLLQAASEDYDWSLDLPLVARIWRAGCIIRSALLDDIAIALDDGPPAGQLTFAPFLAERLAETVPALRRVVAAAVTGGQPVPALTAALGHFDTMRTARGTTSLIQAQRDVFGAHGFDRVDGSPNRHGPWHDR